MSSSVSTTLEQALGLATRLEDTHQHLSAWLEDTEEELRTFAAQEPVGEQLTQAQARQKVGQGQWYFHCH